MWPRRPGVNVAIVCFDGVDELDVFGPYRVFSGAADSGSAIEVRLVTVDRADSVTTSHGVRFEVDGALEDVEPDLLVVPGGGWNARSETSAWAEAERGKIPEAIDRLHGEGVTVAGVCTGTMLLAHAGVIENRPAVTHAGALDDLRKMGVIVRENRVVDIGDVITAGGVTSGIDLALHFLEREFGEEVASSVASAIEYERQYPVFTG